MSTLFFWLINMVLWAGLVLLIHSKPRKPNSKHGVKRYPNAFWNWPDRR